ncbi:hypothetical protein IAU59_000154 [Kwoniella sp. CBS 9459]
MPRQTPSKPSRISTGRPPALPPPPPPSRNKPYPLKSSPFELLPLELKLRIASDLQISGSKADLHSLATSCEAFRAPAESIVWRRVDISLPLAWGGQTKLWSHVKNESGSSHAEVETNGRNASYSTGVDNDDESIRDHMNIYVDWGDASGINFRQGNIESIVRGVNSTDLGTQALCEDWPKSEEARQRLRHCKLYTRLQQVRQAINARPDRLNHIRELILESPPTPHVDDGDDETFIMDVSAAKMWHPKYNQGYRGLLGELLKDLAHHLGTLRLDPGFASSQNFDRRRQAIYGDDQHGPFPRLRELDMPWPCGFSVGGQDPITSVLMWTGSHRLTHLSLRPPWPSNPIEIGDGDGPDSQLLSPPLYQNQIGREGEKEDGIDSARFLSKVKSLSFHDLDTNGLKNISAIFQHITNVENIHFDFEVQTVHAMGAQPLLRLINSVGTKALAELKTLRRITWLGGMESRWIFEKISGKGEGFENVEVLVQSQAIECESETYIDNIYIPPFPSLKYIQVPCRSPRWHRHTKPPEWAKAPPPGTSISAPMIRHLRAAPELLVVQFGTIMQSSSSSSTYASLELRLNSPVVTDLDMGMLNSDRWYNRRVNGVLIRSYVNPVTGDEFYHFRRMELLKVDPKFYLPKPDSSRATATKSSHTPAKVLPTSTSSVLPSSSSPTIQTPARAKAKAESPHKTTEAGRSEDQDYRWVDHTSFKGVAVPPPIVKRVYKLKGEKIEWTNPGRRMALPDEAWAALHKWRRSLPDKGEVGLEGERRIVTRSMGAGSD